MNANTQNIAALGGRFFLAAIFLLAGFSKLGNPSGTIGYIESAGIPLPEVAYAVALLVEIVLAAAVLVGFHTRIAAALIAAFTLVTAFGFHFDLDDQNQFIQFFKNIAIAGGMLQLVAFGAGKYSLDAKQGR